jgi:hypothetical protein
LLTQVSDHFFAPNNPSRHFKKLAKVFTFHDKVLKSINSQAEAVLKPGSHSGSSIPSDHEDVSTVDKLATELYQEWQQYIDQVDLETLQEAVQKQQKRDASNFLVPPPPAFGTRTALSSLLSSNLIVSLTPIGSNTTVHNNLQGSASLLPVNDEIVIIDKKEISSAQFGVKREKKRYLLALMQALCCTLLWVNQTHQWI